GERQGSRGDHRLGQRAVGEECRIEQPPEHVQRRVVGDEQDDGGGDERHDERDEWHDERQPARLLQPALGPHHVSSSPPAMSKPSSSTVVVSASRSPTTAPSNITAMRSASARISSRSSLISSTPIPREAASRRNECTVSIPATSRPRVGDAATSTTGSPENSRASTTFWRLPPESCHAGTCGPDARTS